MSALRRLFLRHPHAAAALVALALLLKIAVPAGFMPMAQGGQIVVKLCNAVDAATMVIDVPGLEHKAGAAAQGSCAFADLSLPALGAADPVQLATLLAFILATALLLAAALPPLQVAHLRPPLRGPPALP